MQHRISIRGQNVPDSPIRKLAGVARAARAKGKHIYYLNIGQPDIFTPPAALEAVKQDQQEVIEYGPAEGMEFLRKQYAEYYHKFGAQFSKEDIFVTTGASEAILFALEN
ncbi:MAG: aminotransferase class I/II-fold pyridoxal phosphate-dependent enzyme [Bacteroidota bacterium]